MKSKEQLIAVLDIGSTKIVCLVAAINNNTGAIKILGGATHLSQGIKAGVITDITEAANAIASCVEAAEKASGELIERVMINITGKKVTSINCEASLALAPHKISQTDIQQVINHGIEHYTNRELVVIHHFPVDFSIDGQGGIKNPLMMYGKKLSCKLHLITAPAPSIYNFADCLSVCRLDIEGIVNSAYASSLACLTEDDIEAGAVIIDIGSAHSSIAIFQEEKLIHIDSVNMGGSHVTSDISKGLSINLSTAERLKILHGSALMTPYDAHKIVELNENGEADHDDNMIYVKYAELTEIIRPRVEENLEMLKAKLDCVFHNTFLKRIILTGGASQLPGIQDLATNILNGQIRVASPIIFPGLDEQYRNPSFSTAIGMLKFATKKNLENHYNKNEEKSKFSWIRKILKLA